MSNIPSFTQQTVRFRGPTSSADYNDMQQKSLYDLVELFNMANTLEQSINDTNDLMTTMGRFQQMQIQDLNNAVAALEAEVASLQVNNKSHVAYCFAPQMSGDITANANEQAEVDPYHGIAYMPVAGTLVSKVYYVDPVTSDIIVPSTLNVVVDPPAGIMQGWQITENSPYNAFSGDDNSYWHRRVIYPAEYVPPNPIQCTLTVTLPDTIISNRDVNMLYLNPFPLNSLQIDSIEYSVDGTNWMLLPSWPVDVSGDPLPATEAGNMKFLIPQTTINQLRVTMTQPTYVIENFQKVYHFGIAELGIFYASYQMNYGNVQIPVHIPGTSTQKTITNITPTFMNDTVLTDTTPNQSQLFTYHIYSVDTNGNYTYLSDSFPVIVGTDDIVLRATIHQDPNIAVSPALQYVEVAYQDM